MVARSLEYGDTALVVGLRLGSSLRSLILASGSPFGPPPIEGVVGERFAVPRSLSVTGRLDFVVGGDDRYCASVRRRRCQAGVVVVYFFCGLR